MIKARILLSVAALVPGVFVMQSTGSASVAVVDFERAIADTPEGKDAINKLNAFGVERRTAIDNKVKQAEELANRIRVQSSVVSDNARTQMTRDLQAAQTEIETMQEEAQNKLNQMRQDLLNPVEAKTVRAVAAYANERGLKIVLDASALRNELVYVHDTADITSEIIRRLVADAGKSGPSNVLLAPRESLEVHMARSFNKKWSLQGDFLKNIQLGSEARH
jgi:Skp family chaperone for outer membrane proteins